MTRSYRLLSWFIRKCTRPMSVEWEEPFEEGPCVFVPNHVGAMGPIDMSEKFPFHGNLAIWCNEGMMNRAEVPDYVRQDYWWKPGCFFEPVLTRTLPYIASWVIPPVLQGAPVIPVYHDNRIMITMRESINALNTGKYLVVFPEQPSGYKDHYNRINTGWFPIGELWYRKTGKALRFYPVHIDHKKHVFRIAKPVSFDVNRRAEEQKEELAALLAKGLRGE